MFSSHSRVTARVIAALCGAALTMSAPDAVRGDTAPKPLPVYAAVSGEQLVHTVKSGETLDQITNRFGVKTWLVTAMNQLPNANQLRRGQGLTLSNRRIVPAHQPDEI